MSVTVLFTDYDKCIYEGLLEAHKKILPPRVKKKIFKFRRWQDRQAFILGKLLVWKGLKLHRYEDDCLTKLQTNSYGKPYIDGNVFFNLSHSGQFVVCAFYKEEIGIDIEEISHIDTDEFKHIFTEQEQNLLTTSSNPAKDFFRFWTIKESVIKAEGKGLSIPLQQINASREGLVQLENKSWHLKEINLSQDYCCAVATRKKPSSIIIEKVHFNTGKPD
jgi:4'-phosphopantetheinyl transferase